MPTFEKLRVSLSRGFASDMLSQAGDPDAHLPRAEYLRRAFSEPLKFLKSGEVFTFHPIESPEGYAAGYFARGRQIPLRHEDLSPYVAENYEPALFMIAIGQGQVVWMEDRPSVGSPKQILESFFRHLLRKTNLKDWSAHVRYFEREESYWDVVQRCRHVISKVTFRFVPPNALEGEELAQVFVTAIQEEVGDDVLEQTLKGKPGQMRLDGPMMRAQAELAEKGAGERELRGPRNRLLYSSKEGKVTAKVDEPDMPTIENQTFVQRVIKRLFD